MNRRGFTLIELLISIILMVILLSAITTIFFNTTETVAKSTARSQVYQQARYALDTLENDLLGCVSFNSGQQNWCMDNGKAVMGKDGAEYPQYGMAGHHTHGAADRLVFRATTTIADTVQTAEIIYELIPGNLALGQNGQFGKGDPDRGRTFPSPNHPEGRPIYTLVRRTRVFNPGTGAYDQIPVDSRQVPVNDAELCTFVTSFNLEYFASNQQFSQLDPSYFSSLVPAGGKNDPLGNGKGENDGMGAPGATPLSVPIIRISITIVEDNRARQERTMVKAIWIPMG